MKRASGIGIGFLIAACLLGLASLVSPANAAGVTLTPDQRSALERIPGVVEGLRMSGAITTPGASVRNRSMELAMDSGWCGEGYTPIFENWFQPDPLDTHCGDATTVSCCYLAIYKFHVLFDNYKACLASRCSSDPKPTSYPDVWCIPTSQNPECQATCKAEYDAAIAAALTAYTGCRASE